MATVFSQPTYAAGEKYEWKDKLKITASSGGYGPYAIKFAKGVVLTKNAATGQFEAVEGYTGTTTDTSRNCELNLGIIVKPNKSSGTLQINWGNYMPGMSGFCADIGSFSKNISIQGDPNKEPERLTVIVRTLRDKNENYGSDTLSLLDQSDKVIAKKDVDDSNRISEDNYYGFEVTFTGIDGKYTSIKACSKEMSLCAARGGLADILGGPLDENVVNIEIRKPIPVVDSSDTSCAMEGVGWIVCPVAIFLGKITDGLFGVLETMLQIEAKMLSTSNPTYSAWQTMRNLANIAFVIAFLFIIYSQITGVGVSNYGIKKLLPKIIIAAILVNTSYWICAAAVDVSNIAGSSMKSLLEGAMSSSGGTSNSLTGWGEVTAWIIAGGATSLAVGGVALTALSAGSVLAALALLLPILVAALFAIITVVLVLAARQAIVIILIVLAPLAFVAYLLPNTEKWFDSWRKTFVTMLLLYPIIAVVFGGSQLAASVIRSGTTSATTYMFSLAIQVVPLFLVPILLKFSGGLLNRFGGIVNNPNKGPFDKLRKGAEGVRDRRVNAGKNAAMNSSSAKNPFRKYLRRQARTEAIDNSQKQGFEAGKAGYISSEAQNNAKFLGQMAAGGGSGASNRALSNAINVKLELELKEVKAAMAVIEDLNLSGDQKAALATGGSVLASNGTKIGGTGGDSLAARLAAQQAVVKSGDAEQINKVVDHMGGLSAGTESQAKELTNFADSLVSSSSKPSYIQPGDLENMKQNGIDGVSMGSSGDMISQALNDNVYSAAKMTQTGRQEMGIVLGHASALPTTDIGRVQLKANATEVLADVRLNTSLGKQRSTVESISRL